MESTIVHFNGTADRDLRHRVVNYLRSRSRAALRNLEVEAANGTVTLRGRVHSFYERQLAINCCHRVAGVLRLVDRIVVDFDLLPHMSNRF